MRLHRALPLLLALPLGAEAPTLSWHGSLWASGTASSRETPSGTPFLRPLETGGFSLDGATLSAGADLGQGWSAKATLLGGRAAEALNLASGESGSLALMEAQLVWTGGKERITVGRMNTFLGMEYLDGAQDLTATRGLLFAFADPFGQVGLAWHHTFTPSWSADLFLFNGEDRLKDNNRGKTVGMAVTYNHGGAADRTVSVHAYRGPEQDGRGAAALPGAEGRSRERLAMMGMWVWGPATLQWEASFAREELAGGTLAGAAGPRTARWGGAGAILRYALSPKVGLFARLERFKDATGIRLAGDPTVAAAWAPRVGADLVASGAALGAERRWGATFARLELRGDRLNRDLPDRDGRLFRNSVSATLALGTSF